MPETAQRLTQQFSLIHLPIKVVLTATNRLSKTPGKRALAISSTFKINIEFFCNV